ncbi:MAG: WD40 repeat domain-containing serine/threonine protein kinase [Isosphaeraceae bacterium]
MAIDPALAEIVEEFTRRVQEGEHVDPDEFVRSHPKWEGLLRILLSTLHDMAQLSQLTMAISPSVPMPLAVTPPATLGEYAIRREIGRGGMGIVYEAEQNSLGRRVALKMLPSAAALDPRSLQRFQIEAHAAACLHHEHIVPVHALGEHDGVPFYVMQFIEGATLAAIIGALRQFREGESTLPGSEPVDPARALALALLADRFGPGRAEARPEPSLDSRTKNYIRAAVRLATQAAEALDHAHEQGIIHRDVKPANLLVDHAGKLWITDFGLARVVGNTTLTVTGDLPGTIRYMSPEQVLGKRALIDSRCDIYALGATLYELLALEPAIVGQERWEILARIDREEPRSLRRLNPAVPRDLATIVAKAMAKDVSSRYSTAQDLAEDLGRFLEGRAVRARRAGLWGQGLRWSRRNPLAAASLAALVLMFVAAFAAVTYQWRRADAEANRANDTARAESALRIQAQVEATKRDLDYAMQLGRRGDADQGLLWTGKALSQAPPERPDLVRLARANIAAWTRQSPCLRAILEHQAAVYDAVFRPDGRAVLTGSCDGTAQVWDATTGRPIGLPMRHSDQVHSVAFSPDGRLILVSGSDGKVQLWNVATGQVAGPILSHGAEILLVAFAPDGRSFMTYGKDWSVRLWNTATGRPVGRLVGRGDSGSVEFSPDGRWLLTGGADGVARLWDAETARPTGVTFRHDDSVTSAKFSPDRRLVATGSKDGTTKFWDAATGQSIGPILRHSVAGTRIVFSPDGRLVLSADYDGTARLWDTATGRPVGLPLRHASEIRSSAFAPDGKLLVTGSFDHTARLWDTATGQPIGAPLRHRLPIRSASFSPDGRLILTASEDGTAKLWEVGSAESL